MAFEKTGIRPKGDSTGYRRGKLINRLRSMRAGIAGLTPSGERFSFQGRFDCTWEDVLSDIDAALATFAAADDLEVRLAVLKKKEPALMAHVLTALGAFEALMVTFLGPSSPKLAHAGLKPKKPRRQLTPEEQVAAHVRSSETRKIRRTMGKNQKKDLKSGPVTVKVTLKK